MKVLYLPGVLGSSLSTPYRGVWLDPWNILNGGLASLQLAADGVSPGPLAEGQTISATGILAPVYSPLAQFMELLGWDVLALGWDWRESHLVTAAAVWPGILAWLGEQPLHVVAHSAGGILARCIYGRMLAAGRGGQLARLVTIGTPHFGSLEIVRLFMRLPTLYRTLSVLTEFSGSGQRPGQPTYLDAVLASMPAWYELMSFAGAGPLFEQFPQQAALIYQESFYQTTNPFVAQAQLTNAELVQGLLGAWLPTAQMVCINGVQVPTAYALADGFDPTTTAGYLYTQDGDGVVTLLQSSPPGASVFSVPVDHGLQPLHPLVWALVAAATP